MITAGQVKRIDRIQGVEYGTPHTDALIGLPVFLHKEMIDCGEGLVDQIEIENRLRVDTLQR